MFERFTDRARRALFFARLATSELGGQVIEPEHLLLGVLRAATGPTRDLLSRAGVGIDSMRQQLSARIATGAKVATSVEIPFSDITKRILAAAATEADQLHHAHIGTEHLLLGVLGEPATDAGQLLIEANLSLETVRHDVARWEAGHDSDD